MRPLERQTKTDALPAAAWNMLNCSDHPVSRQWRQESTNCSLRTGHFHAVELRYVSALSTVSSPGQCFLLTGKSTGSDLCEILIPQYKFAK
jgi:hypothetical protein